MNETWRSNVVNFRKELSFHSFILPPFLSFFPHQPIINHFVQEGAGRERNKKKKREENVSKCIIY
jgi:hypothetical protein